MNPDELRAIVAAHAATHAKLAEYQKRFEPFTHVTVSDPRYSGPGYIVQDPYCPVHKLPIQCDNGVLFHIDICNVTP